MSIDVSFDALAAESGRLDSVAESMSDRIARARSRVDELLRSGWSGAAASSFSSDFAEWAAAADDAVATLRGLVEALDATARDFAETEDQAANTSRSLSEGLDQLGIAAMMGGQ